MDTNSTLNIVTNKVLTFGWLDITLFVLMILASTLIGVYFGIWGKKEDSPKEYLHGGKTMGSLPVAVSLVASFISGIMIMGAPTEIYLYGINYWLICLSLPIIGIIIHLVYLPVFFELQITSTFEYLQLRFNRAARIMASSISTFALILYLPIVVYMPALAFSQVSGISVHIITPVISIVCIFYTMIGGIKAVVWTDVLQGVVMFVASIAVIILGVVNIGGFGTIWQRSLEGGRLHVDFNPSPFERATFWGAVVGHTVHMTAANAINQANIQKLLSVPTYQKAKKSLFIFMILLFFVTTTSCFTGLIIYATYYNCDLVESKKVSRPDQVLPYFVMDVATSIPGLPGLFVAGIFSASLSTMSSSLNAVGAILYEDFVKPCLKKKLTDKTASNIIKVLVVAIGAICVLIVFIVDKLGSVMQLNLSLAGVTLGATLGMFSLGIFLPRANSKGAIVGSIFSIIIMGWIIFGTQKAMADGTIKQPILSSRTDGCEFNTTFTNKTISHANEEVFPLYRLSFMYYVMVGTIITFIVGTITSYVTEPPSEKQRNPVLFMPMLRKMMDKKTIYNVNESADNETLRNSLRIES